MRLKDKLTGEIVEVADNGFLANFDSLKELNKKYEDAPEELKPFEEVAKVGHVLKIGAGQVDWVADDDSVKTLKVSDRDYYEILPDGTKKTEFTWDEAMEIEKKTHGKWRVPTVPEWFAICAAFGRTEDGKDVDPQVLREKLGLSADEAGYGYYWSAATYSTSNSRGLSFRASRLSPRTGHYKGYGFAVRCVASAQ